MTFFNSEISYLTKKVQRLIYMYNRTVCKDEKINTYELEKCLVLIKDIKNKEASGDSLASEVLFFLVDFLKSIKSTNKSSDFLLNEIKISLEDTQYLLSLYINTKFGVRKVLKNAVETSSRVQS